MKRLALLSVTALLLPFSSFGADQLEFDSIYIGVASQQRFEIVKVLRAELPALRIVDRPQDADAVLTFQFGLVTSRGQTTSPEGRPTVTTAGGRTIGSRAVPSVRPDGDPTRTPIGASHVSSVLRVRATGKKIVVFSGLQTPSFATASAKKLVELVAKR